MEVVAALLGAGLFVLVSLVVVAVLRGGFTLARSGKAHLPSRMTTSAEPFDALLLRMQVAGWQERGVRSARGDATLVKRPVTVLISPTVDGGASISFAGLLCNAGELLAARDALGLLFDR